MSEEEKSWQPDMPQYLDLWLVWQILRKLGPAYGVEGFCLTSTIADFMEYYQLARPAKGVVDKTVSEFGEYGTAIIYVKSAFKRTLQGEYLLEELDKMQPKPRTLRFPDDYDLSRLGSLDKWIYPPRHPQIPAQEAQERQHLLQKLKSGEVLDLPAQDIKT